MGGSYNRVPTSGKFSAYQDIRRPGKSEFTHAFEVCLFKGRVVSNLSHRMNYDFVTTDRAASALVKDLRRNSSLAWDTETFGEGAKGKGESFDWVRGEQAWHQWSDGKQAWLVDCTKVNLQLFKPVLESETTTKIIHNSSFDCSWTAREHKIFVNKIWDTRYQEQIVLGVALPRQLTKAEKERYSPLYSASLKYCLSRRGLPDKFVFEPFIKGKPLTEQQPFYMVRDVEFLHTLMEDQKQTIAANGWDNVSYLENAVTEITYKMMVNGFKIDTKGWLKIIEREEKIYYKYLKKLKAIADINWNAWQQYYKFFEVDNTDVLYTDRYQGNEVQMQALLYWRETREHYKAVTTYGREWINQHVHNGVANCSYTQMVSTARYSCDSPNLQNLLPEVTQFFLPSHGFDNVFATADFSGQEMAIMAYGSQEPRWLECLRAGGDLHEMVGKDILGKAYRPEDRKIIKIINFSIAYGAKEDTIAERAGTDVVTIVTRLAAMRRLYPALFQWLDHNAAETRRTWVSYSYPPFNRFRSLAMELSGWRRENIGKNNPVQATAADMAKLAMYYMYQEIKGGLKAWFIHMLHDELIIECHRSNAKKVAAVLVACMNRACTDILGEPLSNPDVEIKNNWDKRKAA